MGRRPPGCIAHGDAERAAGLLLLLLLLLAREDGPLRAIASRLHTLAPRAKSGEAMQVTDDEASLRLARFRCWVFHGRPRDATRAAVNRVESGQSGRQRAGRQAVVLPVWPARLRVLLPCIVGHRGNIAWYMAPAECVIGLGNHQCRWLRKGFLRSGRSESQPKQPTRWLSRADAGLSSLTARCAGSTLSGCQGG
ncbi:hypothetical protein B0J12DRAFT_323722 [Macrophomina phaseolina]|uniref:Uncharacterized protein n=1 Tax=Macrophomina phaseolina TaxID=35725 RepID=A0ABQ8FVP1_9PEZI|nr:hypothetical protein B0J12DRAFT_323722 [Macrophomina phaseolina]